MNNLWAELKRRNVVRVAIAYAVVAWVVLQLVDVLGDIVTFPEGLSQTILIILVIGFPIVLIFSWAFEVTPEGVKKTSEVDQSDSIAHGTGQKINKMIIAGLAIAVVLLLADRFYFKTGQEPVQVAEEGEVDFQEASNLSIAVLPFADLSSGGDQEYFADGLSEEILNVLVGIDDLTVASRTSSFQFKGADLGVPEIAAQLKVTYVLEGSVRKAGDTIRITGQLIEAGTDRHLWSDTFDRELTTENLFAIQDEIAGAIVEALQGELGMSDQQITFNPVGVATENLSAYEKFLQGRNMFHGRADLAHISGAIELFEAAVAEDPNFALAWQWLAAAYSVSMGWALHQEIPRDYPALAKAAATRALELDPTLSFATAIRGFAEIIIPGGDYIFTMNQLEKSLAMNPKDVTVSHWYGIVLREMGFVEAAQEYFDLCQVLDPAFQNCKEHRARNLMYLGDFEAALEEWASFDAEFVRVVPYEIFDSYALAKAGQIYAARLTLSQSFEQQPDFPLTSWVSVISGESSLNSPESLKMENWLDNADIGEIIEGGSSQGADLFMFFYITIGAYDKIDPNQLSPGPGNIKGLWLREAAEFRKTPQFKQVVRNMNFLPYWQANGFPQGCRAVGEEDFTCE